MSILYNEREGRLRAFWRLLLHGVLVTVLMFVFSLPLELVEGTVQAPEVDSAGAGAGPTLPTRALVVAVPGSVAVAFLATWIAAKRLDRRRLSDLGLRLTGAWWADLSVGLGLGAAVIAVVFAVEVLMGWVEVTGFGPAEVGLGAFGLDLLAAVVIFGGVGIYEELVSRGYQMTNIAESFHTQRLGPSGGIYVALIISSLIFAPLHGFNPNASLFGIVNILASSLLLLGMAYALTGRLGLSIGLHASWNFAQSFLFGLPVSGARVGETALIISRQSGPELWTGGAFGLEGGLLGSVAVVLACAGMLVWIHRREGRIAVAEEIARPPSPGR